LKRKRANGSGRFGERTRTGKLTLDEQGEVMRTGREDLGRKKG